MDRQELAEILRTSLPSKRMLEVVSIGAVKVGSKLIILKQRPSYEFKEDEAVLYSERHDIGHHYKEIQAKTVIFDTKLLNLRGQEAIKEFNRYWDKARENCGRPYDARDVGTW